MTARPPQPAQALAGPGQGAVRAAPMLAVLEEPRIAFVGIPKCMSTSLGRFFYRHETGHDYRPADHGGLYVHQYFSRRARRAAYSLDRPASLDGFWKFTVIRDPVARLLSAHGNRVMRHGMLRPLWPDDPDAPVPAALAGLDPMPSIDAFLVDLERYRAVSRDIGYHTAPISAFIGTDLSRFDALFRIEDTAPLIAALSRRLGGPVVLDRVQTSLHAHSFDALSDAARRAALTYSRADYDLLEDYYEMPDTEP
jgi:hypothetical protein